MASCFENQRHYCMAGHTALAKMQKMDPAVTSALRGRSRPSSRRPELALPGGSQG
jgi:hypothetical protein